MTIQNPYRFNSEVSLEPNTFIGGVALNIPTASALASVLNISESNITYFEKVGLDIHCKIDISYAIPANAFQSDSKIRRYEDPEGKLTSVGGSAFHLSGIRRFYSTANVSVSAYAFRECTMVTIDIGNVTNLINLSLTQLSAQYINIRSATILGDSVGNNNVFNLLNGNPSIYAHASLETINSGGIEGDLAYAQTRGATLTFVQNYTLPNNITDLSIGTKFATALQLNFTPPNSTNAIQFYECYANGAYKNTIKRSGQYITGLTPSTQYNIEIKPVDIYYNRSTSNVVSQLTNTTEPYPVSKIISYYKTEDDVLDSIGNNDGVANNISYADGLVGRTAVFNGSSSYINLGNPIDFNFSDNFSIVLVFENTTDSSYRDFIRKAKISGSYQGWDLIKMNNNKIRFEMFKNTTNIYSIFSDSVITSNQKTILIITVASGVAKMYVQGTLQADSKTVEITPASATNCQIGGGPNAFYNNGKEEEISLWNAGLTQSQVTEITNKLQSGQSLI